jgi:prevent-host-death family protein
MLDLANDVRSLTDFKRNTIHLLDRFRRTGHPLVLTINGKAELVVQDAEAYQALTAWKRSKGFSAASPT